ELGHCEGLVHLLDGTVRLVNQRLRVGRDSICHATHVLAPSLCYPRRSDCRTATCGGLHATCKAITVARTAIPFYRDEGQRRVPRRSSIRTVFTRRSSALGLARPSLMWEASASRVRSRAV